MSRRADTKEKTEQLYRNFLLGIREVNWPHEAAGVPLNLRKKKYNDVFSFLFQSKLEIRNRFI